MSNGNFKARCVIAEATHFVKGKVYEVVDGELFGEGGLCKYSAPNIETLNADICSQFELVEEKENEKMSKWNGKIRCLDTNAELHYTKNKVYDVKDGIITFDSGERHGVHENLADFLCYTGAKFEEIIDMRDLRKMLKPCMLAKFLDGTFGIVVQCGRGVVLKRFDSMDWMKVDDYGKDLKTIRRVSAEWDIVKVYGCAWLIQDVLSPIAGSRELIWKREVKTPQQIEIEQIEAEQRKLADRLSELRKGL